MNDLTYEQTKLLNTMSGKVLLGTKFQQMISALKSAPTAGTPVNAVAATKVLAVTGVVIDGETVIINNPAATGVDTYEFLADTAQTKTAPGNIAVNITPSTTKASGTLSVPTQPTAGDTMTIGAKVYTFVAVGTAIADGDVPVGATLAAARLAIVAAINGIDDVNTPHPLVTASVFVGAVTTITALVGGVSGNAVGTVETFTAVGNVFGGTTLGAGADCSAANAITALVSAVTAHDTQGVGAVDATGGNITLTADVAGAVGNAIAIGETMAHGAFAGGAVLLSGGVSGTVGLAFQMMVDATYLYVCLAANTTGGANWRRMPVGSVY